MMPLPVRKVVTKTIRKVPGFAAPSQVYDGAGCTVSTPRGTPTQTTFLGALCRLLLGYSFLLFANKRQPALQFRAEVCFISRNLDRFQGRLSPKPAIQLLARGGLYVSSLFSDWHTIGRPSLRDRNWLTEEGDDLLPTFKRRRFCCWFLLFRNGASTMLTRAVGLQGGFRAWHDTGLPVETKRQAA